MSVLSFPRLYFKGWMQWDPCTVNNNDFLNTYDGARAALNWPFLATVGPPGGITPQNFQTTFRPWISAYQPDLAGGMIPAEWNIFGSHSVTFLQNGGDQSTVVTGGATGPDAVVTSGDPLIGGPITLLGDQGTPPVMVDVDPSAYWATQVFWSSLSIGGGDAVISGSRSVRLHSRWLNLVRVYNAANANTQPAAAVAACFQTAIPFGDVQWPAKGVSGLADSLQAAAQAPGAQGIMVRFTAYVNLYFQNGILNDFLVRPRGYEELADILAVLWTEWNAKKHTTAGFFSNPCYSHIVGAVGVWNDDELASVPGGRYLAAQNAVAPIGSTAVAQAVVAATSAVSNADVRAATDEAVPDVSPGGHAGALTIAAVPAAPGATSLPTTALGPAVAEYDRQLGILSIDLSSTIPEFGSNLIAADSDLPKLDIGPLTVGVLGETGDFTPVGTIDYEQYAEAAYEASAGIVDLTLTGPLPAGPLSIQAQGIDVLQEQPFTAQTDDRGIYLDQGGQTTFSILVCQNGVPSPGANVMIARYGPAEQEPQNNSSLNVVPSGSAEQVVDFTTGTVSTVTVPSTSIQTEVTTVTADENGIATVGLSAQSFGFMNLAFFPYAAGAAPPQDIPLAALGSGPPSPPFNTSITYCYYTAIRVLPFDDDLPQQFCDLWNSTHDQTQAWNFIYSPTSPGGGILYLYDMVFNVMLEHVWLGNQQAVESAAARIWQLISPGAASELTNVMPITRDLSAGKQTVLQLWIYLVLNGYPTSPPLTVDSINGFSPRR